MGHIPFALSFNVVYPERVLGTGEIPTPPHPAFNVDRVVCTSVDLVAWLPEASNAFSTLLVFLFFLMDLIVKSFSS